ncbi:MAG: translation initiation factor IF-2 [Candidatus Margulisiibacteriota bacterium]
MKKPESKKTTAVKKTARIKIEQLARELGADIKKLLSNLKDLGIAAKTRASSIDEESATIIRDLFLAEGKKEPEVKSTHKLEEPESGTEAPKANIIVIPSGKITVKELSEKLKVKVSDLIKELMIKGAMVTINQQIDFPMAAELAGKLGFELREAEEKAKSKGLSGLKEDPLKLKARPPVVTIMGHVDHGKTKLLDAIRKTNVIDTEAGGITQHIGAYQVEINGKLITFLDTPGHEAFTALRARGAEITDIVVIVVAADDGIMPQTKEAIDHAKASSASIIVAINKIDKPDANVDRVKQQLSELGLSPEDWGGQTITVPVSAKQGTGIDHLLEMILLVAEMLELKANPLCLASGVVIEATMDKSMGPVATVLVQRGTLKVGESFYSGSTFGKVRALINDKGKRISKAPPSTPVKIFGIADVPVSGDTFNAVKADKEARIAAEKAKESESAVKNQSRIFSLEDFSQKIKSGELKTLNLIIKADVQGSVEAIVKSLENLSGENVKTHIVLSNNGNISKGDIMLAKASEAIIIGFNVDYEADSKQIAESEGVDARLYNIIYNVIDDVKLAMVGMLEPEYEEAITGHAEIRQLFKYSKVGTIAGSIVTDGMINRNNSVRVIRAGEVLFNGKLNSLKRFKDDVKEVAAGAECGIVVEGFEKVIVGDIVEQFEMRKKKRNVKIG